MSAPDQPHAPLEGQKEPQQQPASLTDVFDEAQHHKLTLLKQVNDPKLKKLAEEELAELTNLETQRV